MAATASPQPIYPKRRRSRPTPPSPPPPSSHFTSQAMDTMAVNSPTFYGGAGNDSSFNSSFNKFNSALTAGLLNPNSPPPCSDKVRSSPSLFEMMANEPDCSPSVQIPTSNAVVLLPKSQIPPQDKQVLMHQRLSELLTCRSPGNQFNDARSGDLNLHLSSKDGCNVSMNVHKQILVAHSRYFAGKLSDRWLKLQRNTNPYIFEIPDCDNIEVYIETLRLMYCSDLRKKLMMEGVTKVLAILKVSAAIEFDAGVYSCLEYLEAAPWTELEEQKIASLLSELRLEAAGAGEVLKRLSIDVTTGVESPIDNDKILVNLLHVVLEGKDEKARREMKGLVSKMLKENSSQNELRKESLYSASDRSLQLLHRHFSQAAAGDLQDSAQISRQADNLHWLLDILIDRQISNEFLMTWASQFDLSDAHSKVPVIHRYEVSRVTARFFVGIGKGQLMASKEARCLLLKTWLVPFYDDFGWLVRRASKGFDRHVVEDGLSHTILTLPLANQQEILVSWFDRFLNCSDDCPNLQRGFEVWWRRAFGRRNGKVEPRQIRIVS